MKRSKINQVIKEMEKTLEQYQIQLPPFSKWTSQEWKIKNHEYDEIKDNALGWDITDCGLERFDEIGFALFTIRNGNQKIEKYKKVYAEKIILLREAQTFPTHFHWMKSEDIINRGGGVLLIQVFNDDGEGGLDDSDILVNCDGRSYYVPAGTKVELHPGESITLWPHQYHNFSVVPGTGNVVIGEISMCNDDNSDNRFYEPMGRFPIIEEDEEPYRLLCNEYPDLKEC